MLVISYVFVIILAIVFLSSFNDGQRDMYVDSQK